jgi:sugar lactone lactonase YvrE
VLAILSLVLLVATGNNAETEGARRILQWLLIFLALGGVLFGAAYGVVRGGFKQGVRLLTVGLVALLFLLTVRTTFMLNYINYDMATEFLVYAHAGPDVKRALAEIDTISQRTVGDRNIVVAYDNESSWPLSWYMRQYPNAKFYGDTPTTDAMAAPVIIVAAENRAKVEPYVARDYVKRTYRLIWWPEMEYFNLSWERVWGAIADPAQRQRLFDIIAFRKYRDPANLSEYRDLAQWPYRKEFDMYVRRDLAPLIWDLNVLPMAEQAPLDIPVILPEQIRSVDAVAVYNVTYGGLPLLNPRAVAVGPNGERVIADTGNHRIVVLDSAGGYVRSFGSYCNLTDPTNTPCSDPDGDGPLATGDGQFYEPWGVAVDGEGSIYVADTWNGRIQVFAPDGTFVRRWGVFAIAEGDNADPNALFGPRGLAFDLDGNLLAADTGNKRIVRFRPSGEYVDQVGGGGVTAGRFEEPSDVAVDPTNGTILVADAWNGRVQRFGSDLVYQSEFAVPGWAGRDVYQKPYLTVAADGTIYTTDPATGQVVAYDPTGQVKLAFGGQGALLNQIGVPNGIRVDLPNNSLVVADGGNNRVMVFPIVQ